MSIDRLYFCCCPLNFHLRVGRVRGCGKLSPQPVQGDTPSPAGRHIRAAKTCSIFRGREINCRNNLTRFAVISNGAHSGASGVWDFVSRPRNPRNPADFGAAVVHDRGEAVGIEGWGQWRLRCRVPKLRPSEAATNSAARDRRHAGGERSCELPSRGKWPEPCDAASGPHR